MITTYYPPLPIRGSTTKLSKQNIQPSLRDILEDVCACFDESIDNVIGPKKKDEYVRCRRIYSYVSNVLTGWPQKDIAAILNRDRTSCLNLLNQVADWFSVNEEKFMKEWDMYVSKSRIWQDYYNKKIKSHAEYGQSSALVN